MDSSAVVTIATVAAAVGQIASAIAVIVTVVFVGRQLQHSVRELRTSAFHGVAGNVIALNSLFIADPEFTDLYLRARRDAADLSPSDALRVHLFMIAVFRHYDDLYYQFRAGNLDPELWSGWKHTFGTWLRDHTWGAWFEKNADHFSKPLSALVRELTLPRSTSTPAASPPSEQPTVVN